MINNINYLKLYFTWNGHDSVFYVLILYILYIILWI